ncbi:hypothetical protein P167DRAFT_482451, partial [Morchella conica CCBAS932]
GPPPPSAEEVRDQELVAKKSIQAVLGTCLVLYLCMHPTCSFVYIFQELELIGLCSVM